MTNMNIQYNATRPPKNLWQVFFLYMFNIFCHIFKVFVFLCSWAEFYFADWDHYTVHVSASISVCRNYFTLVTFLAVKN